MQIEAIADITNVDEGNVRAFLSRNKIKRDRKQGIRGVWVDMDQYIAVLKKKGYTTEAAKLEGALEGGE